MSCQLARLLDGDLKVVTKVQLDTDYVRKLKGRKVIDVLKQCDDRGQLEDLTTRLELTHVLTREVQQLSGGELVAVRSASGKPKYVIAVEHDLAVLDYMSDYVNCLYGDPGAYGVITKIATNTVGINNYLAGYFPAENMCFRPDEITFQVRTGVDME